MSWVGDRHDALHLVGDVGERRLAVRHLVEDAAEAPDVAGFTQFHDFVGGGGGAPSAAVVAVVVEGATLESMRASGDM